MIDLKLVSPARSEKEAQAVGCGSPAFCLTTLSKLQLNVVFRYLPFPLQEQVTGQSQSSASSCSSHHKQIPPRGLDPHPATNQNVLNPNPLVPGCGTGVRTSSLLPPWVKRMCRFDSAPLSRTCRSGARVPVRLLCRAANHTEDTCTSRSRVY